MRLAIASTARSERRIAVRGPPRERSGSRRRVSARAFKFYSGLVDLVIYVGRHSGGGHRIAPVGEQFVVSITEHIAQVGDRGGDFGDPPGEGLRAKPAMVAAGS